MENELPKVEADITQDWNLKQQNSRKTVRTVVWRIAMIAVSKISFKLDFGHQWSVLGPMQQHNCSNGSSKTYSVTGQPSVKTRSKFLTTSFPTASGVSVCQVEARNLWPFLAELEGVFLCPQKWLQYVYPSIEEEFVLSTELFGAFFIDLSTCA